MKIVKRQQISLLNKAACQGLYKAPIGNILNVCAQKFSPRYHLLQYSHLAPLNTVTTTSRSGDLTPAPLFEAPPVSECRFAP